MQRKTTASNSLPDDWEALGRLMALRLAYYVKVYGIPKELVVGLDETPVKTTPNAELATRALRNSGDVAGRARSRCSAVEVDRAGICLGCGSFGGKRRLQGSHRAHS